MSESSPVERALDVIVYAPLGVALLARDALPGIAGMFAARGRSEIAQRRRLVAQQVAQARTVGRFAVRFGGPEVRRRVEGSVASARATAETTLAGLGGHASGDTLIAPAARTGSGRGTARARPASEAPAVAATNGRRPPPAPAETDPAAPASALAIPDYDELSASQVVGRLEGLVDADLETIGAYESAHRNRRTILGKIAQLRR